MLLIANTDISNPNSTASTLQLLLQVSSLMFVCTLQRESLPFTISVKVQKDANYRFCVGLKDVLEEAASIVVILRLWRVFKIVEEFSAGASDRKYSSSLLTPNQYQESLTLLAFPHCLEAMLTFNSNLEMDVLNEKIETLEKENQELKRELKVRKDDDNGQ